MCRVRLALDDQSSSSSQEESCLLLAEKWPNVKEEEYCDVGVSCTFPMIEAKLYPCLC
jgi:hypothetical protein